MPTKDQIDSILPFLDCFESPDSEALTPETFFESVQDFWDALYSNNWVRSDFDWPSWIEANEDFLDPSKIQTADLETIQKLFTTHIRLERFCDGYAIGLFRDGILVALLRRLKELRKELD